MPRLELILLPLASTGGYNDQRCTFTDRSRKASRLPRPCPDSAKRANFRDGWDIQKAHPDEHQDRDQDDIEGKGWSHDRFSGETAAPNGDQA